MDTEAKIIEPIGWEWAAFESGKQMSEWKPEKRWFGQSGWEAISRRAPEKYEIRKRPLCLLEDAEAEVKRLTKYIEELEEALDEREIESGLTSNGNLWRYWSKKAKDLASKLEDALLAAESWQDDASYEIGGSPRLWRDRALAAETALTIITDPEMLPSNGDPGVLREYAKSALQEVKSK